MSIANTAQAEHWNSGEDAAHWTANQARYDRTLEPFAAMILEAAALQPSRPTRRFTPSSLPVSTP